MCKVCTCVLLYLCLTVNLSIALEGKISSYKTGNTLTLSWSGDEHINVSVDNQKGIYSSPVQIQVNQKEITFDGFYTHLNGVKRDFTSSLLQCSIENNRITAVHELHHSQLKHTARLKFELWFEVQSRALHALCTLNGTEVHLDQLGIGKYHGKDIRSNRMFFGRMYVIENPKAFEHKHDWFTCRYWLRQMENGINELQATKGSAKGFRYDPQGYFDLYTYCDTPVEYLFYFSEKDPQDIFAEYRDSFEIESPPALSQLPGRVGLHASYPISERYEDFLEEWTGRGARDFVWNSYFPTPGEREYLEQYGALYSIYDTYFDAFDKGPRKMKGITPEMLEYDESGNVISGYWYAPRVLPSIYAQLATNREMGLLGREYRDESGERAWLPTKATRYSNLKVTREEINPNGLYMDVHLSKIPYHYWDHQGKHHSTAEFVKGQKELFEFIRSYMGNIPIWAEGGAEDFIGIMDGGWYLANIPLEEQGIDSEHWQYYPTLDQIHRERVLNMGLYYPLESYDVDQVNAAILLGHPQAVSVYFNSSQEELSGRLMVYYMTKAFHKNLGLSRLERVEFDNNDIDRTIIHYSNGAKVWCNRSQSNWLVESFDLPPMGWLIKGPNDFLEYRALKDGEPVDVVYDDEYNFFSSHKRTDFGSIVLNGAIAVNQKDPKKLTLYEIRKPKGVITLKLNEILQTDKPVRVTQIWACMTQDRKLELQFPDWRQFSDPTDNNNLGNVLEIRPVEMRSVLKYEIQFESM